ncbi:MAG: FecR domain-containing protein [Cyclobacteriaceae bacterium]
MFDPDKSIYAYLTGRLNSWETRELIQWMNESADNKKKFKAIRAYWENSSETIVLEESTMDQAFNKLSNELFDNTQAEANGKVVNMDTRKGNRHSWMYVAASVVLLIGIFFYTGRNDYAIEDKAIVATIVKENPAGRRSQIALPDGTKVWLNAASKVIYSETFGQTDRNISLTGEAYFDIRKNEALPFVVSTESLSVTALGTEFNVRSYSEEASAEVLLTQGKVVVADLKNQNEDMYLRAGESLSYANKGGIFEKNQLNFEHLLAWRSGILSFQEASEQEVISRLERWYGVKVRVENSHSGQPWEYTSRFENESLENVLYSMSHVKKFEFNIDGEDVTLKYKN